MTEKMTEWRPIDEGAKTGEKVILYPLPAHMPKCQPFVVGVWMEMEGVWAWPLRESGKGIYDKWSDLDLKLGHRYEHFTHYMPLPPDPGSRPIADYRWHKWGKGIVYPCVVVYKEDGMLVADVVTDDASLNELTREVLAWRKIPDLPSTTGAWKEWYPAVVDPGGILNGDGFVLCLTNDGKMFIANKWYDLPMRYSHWMRIIPPSWVG